VNARARARVANDVTFASLVADELAPARLEELAHPQDWPAWPAWPSWPDEPEQQPAAALPRELWSRVLGDLARDILARPGRRFRARLAELAFRLGGAPGEPPRALAAMVEIIHAGSLIVDDIEDASSTRRGEPCLHVRYGVPLALNAGNWMYFWALGLVDVIEPHAPAVRDRLHRAVVGTMARCHLGQALDLGADVSRLPRAAVYRTVATSTSLKTGALMELAARAGAIVAGAPPEREEALARFGRRLGLGLQMLDDFGNLTARAEAGRTDKALEDLRNGTPTWPWALASRTLDEPSFEELQASARALGEAREPDDGHLRALAASLRMAVGPEGRTLASHYLAGALADLRVAVGARPELAAVAKEISRLEASYG
jgi:geranylgeranyl pyrophosphate synthase